MKADNEILNDENWWEAVMSDESRQGAQKKNTAQKHKAQYPALDWNKAQRIYQDDSLVTLTVVGHNQGGVLVEGENLKGFVPYSHLVQVQNNISSKKKAASLAAYLGKTLSLKLIECFPKEDRIIFSERAAQAGAGRRREIFSMLQRGKIVEGKVTNITDFGVFVDLGGVEGLVHISELSWGRVEHPRQVAQMDEKIRVQILSFSPERCRVALSLKRLQPNPWEKVHEKYRAGQIVSAEITSVVPFGVFARLEEGIEGLIHNSEIPQSKRDLLKKDTVIEAKILRIEAKKQRMSLSLNFGESYD
jgi:small subunit ribosomal protein S1